MTEQPSDHVEALFYEAADLSPEQQCALLDAACHGDPRLRARVETLLADDARLRTGKDATAFLNSPLIRALAPPGVAGATAETKDWRGGVSPLKTRPLKRLSLDYRADREELLRSLTGLESINDKPAAEFWKEVADK